MHGTVRSIIGSDIEPEPHTVPQSLSAHTPLCSLNVSSTPWWAWHSTAFGMEEMISIIGRVRIGCVCIDWLFGLNRVRKHRWKRWECRQCRQWIHWTGCSKLVRRQDIRVFVSLVLLIFLIYCNLNEQKRGWRCKGWKSEQVKTENAILKGFNGGNNEMTMKMTIKTLWPCIWSRVKRCIDPDHQDFNKWMEWHFCFCFIFICIHPHILW